MTVRFRPAPHSDIALTALAVIDGVGRATESACSSRRGLADEFANRGCWVAAVVAGVGPSAGVGLVGVVFDCGRRAAIEQLTDHVVASELDGEVQRGRVAVGARVDVHPGVEELVDDGAPVAQRGEHEGLAEDLAWIV